MDQRSHQRLQFQSEFAVQNGHRAVGRGLDLSSSGLGFRIQEQLEVGSRVKLVFQNDTFLVEGEVRYCTPDSPDSGYRSGVRFTLDGRHIMPVLLMLDQYRDQNH